MLPVKLADQPTLPSWRVGEPLPAGTSREGIAARLDSIHEALEPGGKQGVAVAVAMLCEFARSYGMKADPSGMVALYEMALGEHPLWAVETAVTSTLACWDNRFAPPMPAEIVKALPGVLWRLRSEQVRLRQALRAYDRGEIESGEPNADPAEAMALLADIMRGAA